MNAFKCFSLSFSVFLLVCLVPQKAFAKTFDLFPPTGALSRGQEVKFIIQLDTQGENIKSDTIGLSYQSQYLEYVKIEPGDAMTSVSPSQVGTDKLLISGTNPSGFTGSGVYAYVTFKIIATGPGTAELCAIFNPSPTPTVKPTSVPKPTALPKTGVVENVNAAGLIGTVFILSSMIGLIGLRKAKYS